MDLFVVLPHFGFVVLILFSIFIGDPVEFVEAVISGDATLLMFSSWECLPDVPMACAVFALVALPTLGADSVFPLGGETVFTLGVVVGVVLVLTEFALAPAILVVSIFPIFLYVGLFQYPGFLGEMIVLLDMDSGRCREFH